MKDFTQYDQVHTGLFGAVFDALIKEKKNKTIKRRGKLLLIDLIPTVHEKTAAPTWPDHTSAAMQCRTC